MIKKRILEYAEKRGIKRSKFPERIGMSASGFRGEAMKSGINSEAIDKILSIFPEVDLHWLITGSSKKEEIHEENVVKEAELNYGNNDFRKKYYDQLEKTEKLRVAYEESQEKIIQMLESTKSKKTEE